MKTATVILYSDAKAKNDRYGITDKKGQPVWYGKFFSSDHDYNGEQSSGEMAAAKKAVWLASKIKEANNLESITLILFVDAQWLVWANAVKEGSNAGGKARALGLAAQRLGVDLAVRHVPGIDNPADKYTICTGYLNWRDVDLTTLIEKE